MMPEQAQSQTVLAYWLLPAPPAREFPARNIRETHPINPPPYDVPLAKPDQR